MISKKPTKIKKRQIKQKELMVRQLKKSPIVEASCQKIGISRATFYRWMKQDVNFNEEVEKALDAGRSLINDLAESKLIKAIQEQNMTAIIFWLKHQNKNFKSKVELSGQVVTSSRKLTPQEEAIIGKALQHGGFNSNNPQKNV